MVAIGYVAAILTIASFLAQSGKIVRSRDVSGISAPMWALSTTAFGLWIAYGVLRGDWALIIPNTVCMALAGFILMLKLLPARKRDQVADKLSPSV